MGFEKHSLCRSQQTICPVGLMLLGEANKILKKQVEKNKSKKQKVCPWETFFIANDGETVKIYLNIQNVEIYLIRPGLKKEV